MIEIATEAMFQHHYYTFGGKQFQQMEGGPIGLRGTCTIARLVMQIFDRKWERLIKGAGVKLELYWRCMNDGRIGLHPIKRGWSWVDGTMQYCLRWEKEDEGRDLLEVTVEALRGSMRGVMNYLEFTFESGQDYEDGWLPTLDTNLRVGEQNIISYNITKKASNSVCDCVSILGIDKNGMVEGVAWVAVGGCGEVLVKLVKRLGMGWLWR